MKGLSIGAANARIKKVFANRYTVKQSLGEGGMGCVFLVESSERASLVFALKLLSKREYLSYADIYAEVFSLQDLKHQGIPKIIEVREDSEYVYILQDYIFGSDLGKIVKTYGPVPEHLIVYWMESLAIILSYLHSQGVIHRDIKPANIMLDETGHIKVIDFGLARDHNLMDEVDSCVVGTKPYTPPERYVRKNADEQTDIYAYGSTLYFLASGETPAAVDHDPALNISKMMRKLERRVSPALFHIIRNTMMPHPQDRYKQFNEILFDIERIALYNDSIMKVKKRASRYGLAGALLLTFGAGLLLTGLLLL